VRLGMSLLNNMVVAGEVPLALAMYIDLPEKGKRAGQPIDWFALEPVMAMGFNVSVARLAPHPNAAALFEDYMLSPETQKLLSSLFFYPASTKAQSIYPKLNVKLIDPVFSVDTYDKWNKSYEDVVTKRTR
jgi:iron(III) transport system substrate-binding protein